MIQWLTLKVDEDFWAAPRSTCRDGPMGSRCGLRAQLVPRLRWCCTRHQNGCGMVTVPKGGTTDPLYIDGYMGYDHDGSIYLYGMFVLTTKNPVKRPRFWVFPNMRVRLIIQEISFQGCHTILAISCGLPGPVCSLHWMFFGHLTGMKDIILRCTSILLIPFPKVLCHCKWRVI